MSALPNIVRAAVVAAVVGTAGLAALPAQAAPYFQYGYGMGHGPYVRDHFIHRPYFPRPVCLSDRAVRYALERAGYYNVNLFGGRGDHVRARASKFGRSYLIDFNRCGGYIEHVQPLYRS